MTLTVLSRLGHDFECLIPAGIWLLLSYLRPEYGVDCLIYAMFAGTEALAKPVSEVSDIVDKSESCSPVLSMPFDCLIMTLTVLSVPFDCLIMASTVLYVPFDCLIMALTVLSAGTEALAKPVSEVSDIVDKSVSYSPGYGSDCLIPAACLIPAGI